MNHTVGVGVWVEDNYVPWGGKLCLTPADARTYQGACPCSEGDMARCGTLCTYSKFTVNFTEVNEGTQLVTGPGGGTYVNTVHLDGELTYSVAYPAIRAGAYRVNSVEFRLREDGAQLRPGAVEYWGVVDDGAHNVTFTVGSSNATGTISVQCVPLPCHTCFVRVLCCACRVVLGVWR